MPISFADAHQALTGGATTAVDLSARFLAHIDAHNTRLNAFVGRDDAAVRTQAEALDARLAAGETPPLAGLMLGVKDTICTTDFQTTCASQMLQGFTSLIDATAVRRLREAGAVVLGKLNCDEFAMGSSNENSFYGPAHNPADPARVPGGSSGGSAAAVAAGLCHAALGSDTGGSIRQPAAFCGAVGLKPTYGRVSRYGLVAFASSFDCIGPLTSSVRDAARLLGVMAGLDANDTTSAPAEVPDYLSAVDQGVEGLRVGVPDEFMGEGLDPAIRARVEAAAAHLEAQGATIQSVSLPHTRYGIAAYYVLTTAEASSNLARYDGVRYGYRSGQTADDLEAFYVHNRTEGFGDEVKRRIMLGTYVLSSGYYDAYYGRAQRVRRLFQQDYTRAFEQVDVLLTPATPTPAFALGANMDDPLDMYLNDVYTVTANLAGIPGLVVPAGTHPDSDLPIGVQLLGPSLGEATVLRAGHVLESMA
jgi:aspartyl-tRNA(Asn)/glutamyl-tRNA(Gln) amidotransferase subunit A